MAKLPPLQVKAKTRKGTRLFPHRQQLMTSRYSMCCRIWTKAYMTII
jgi:hypothetical protein